MSFKRMFTLIAICVVCLTPSVHAEETDQFTLPPAELQDIGPAASFRLYEVLEKVVAQTNAEIRRLESISEDSKHATTQLALRRKGPYLADLVYKNTGPGFPRWMRWYLLPKEDKPMQYKEFLPWKTVYWLVFSQSPLFIIGLAPTINMYGHEFGTDKLGHFFMQGHTYYKMYTYFIENGRTPEQARANIVTYGQILEQTYLGVLINGIYSNGDLAGNYSGWKFYTNLTQSIKVGKRTIPPILVLKNGQWEFSKHVNKYELLKPYISDVLNEAYNPCRYTFMRAQIRRQIKKRCNAWIERKGLTQQLVEAKLKETSLWNGENYGHWLPKSSAATLNVCFGGN